VRSRAIFIVFLIRVILAIQQAYDASSQATLLVTLLSRSGLHMPIWAALGGRRVLLLENLFNYHPPGRNSSRLTSAPGRVGTCPC
jgi:hypothetical protein